MEKTITFISGLFGVSCYYCDTVKPTVYKKLSGLMKHIESKHPNVLKVIVQ